MLSGTTEKLDDTARNMEKLLDETRNLLRPLRSNNNSRTKNRWPQSSSSLRNNPRVWINMKASNFLMYTEPDFKSYVEYLRND
jgi:uncharacterized protein HemY